MRSEADTSSCKLPRNAFLISVLWMFIISLWGAKAADFDYSWGHPLPQGNAIFGMTFHDAETGWAVGGGGCVLRTDDAGESWTLLQQPGVLDADLTDIMAIDEQMLIAVGTPPSIFRSLDGGLSWSFPPHPASGTLVDLAPIPGGGVSAAGESGVVLRSDDGGATWVDVGPGTGTPRHHVWRSEQEAFLVGFELAHRTVDGGATWTELFTPSFFGANEVYFADATTGYVVGDFETWRSNDGGVSWAEVVGTSPSYRVRTVVLTPQHWYTVCFGEGGEFWETTDAGATWTDHLFQNNGGYPCLVRTSIGRVHFGSDTADLYWTDDPASGFHNATENHALAAVGAPILTIAARPDGVLFAANQPSSVGEPEAWLRSDDGGAHWFAPADAPGLRWVIDAAFDATTGLAGSYADIRYSSDGGETWAASTLPGDNRVSQFAMPAPDRYFVAAWTPSGGGSLFRSSDGGSSWTPVGGGLPAGSLAATAVVFADSQIGYVSGLVGSTPRLYRTVDGGQTWSLVSATGLGEMIEDMVWLDATTGIAALFASPHQGLYRTVNAGASWTRVSDVKSSGVFFRDALQGIAVGRQNAPAQVTEDGGLTWNLLDAPISSSIPGIAGSIYTAQPLPDRWIIGATRNRLLIAQDSDISSVATDDRGRTAGSSVLLWAYSNPFSEATTLHFALASADDVQLAVYDSAGRLVRELHRGTFAAGEHVMQWDGRSDAGTPLPAGVYFARLASRLGAGDVRLTLLR